MAPSDPPSSRRGPRPPCEGPGLPKWVRSIQIPTPYPIGPVTVYLLLGDPLTLVDTGPGTREAWEALTEGLARHHVRPGDLRRVLITHGHHDHYGLAWRLARLGATLHAHPWERDSLERRRRYPRLAAGLARAGLPLGDRIRVLVGLWQLDRTLRPVRSVEWLATGQTLAHEHGPIAVYHLPGHTPGHLGFGLGASGAMVSGDTLLVGITPNAIVNLHPEDPTRTFPSLQAYAATLDTLERIAPARLLPAHGPCIADVAGEIATLRGRQAKRAAEVRAALAAGEATVAEVMHAVFPRLRRGAMFLAFSEIAGFLHELERCGEIARFSGRRRDRFRLTSSR